MKTRQDKYTFAPHFRFLVMSGTMIRVVLICCIPSLLSAQLVQIKGSVNDANSNVAIIGASVQAGLHKTGTFTDEQGTFELDLPIGKEILIISSIGYQSKTISINVEKSETIQILLLVDTIQLSTVTVRPTVEEYTVTPGSVQLSATEIKLLPSIGGERDPIKAFGLLPGVSGGREGQTSLLVRGGDRDQTLYLLDGAPIYNIGHYLDLLSVFNPDAIQSATLLKGNFPPRYGGSLSGVLDITTRAGNAEEWSGKGELGLISSKILLEGPLDRQGKTTFLLTGRASYLDIFTLGKRKKVLQFYNDEYNGFRFFDTYTKVSHRLNQHQQFSVGILFSFDQREQMEAFGGGGSLRSNTENLQTISAYLNYKWEPNPKLSAQIIVFTNFNKSANDNQDAIFELFSELPGFTPATIQDTLSYGSYKSATSFSTSGIRIESKYRVSAKHSLVSGLQAGLYRHNLLKANLQSEYANFPTFEEATSLPLLSSREAIFHIDDNWEINDKWIFSFGSRLSLYGTPEKYFINIAPRFATNYRFSDVFDVKAGYGRMYQYNKLLLSNGLALSDDLSVWLPSTQKVPPAYSDQFGCEIVGYTPGFFREVKVGGYYKIMHRLIERSYRLQEVDSWEDAVFTNGTGTSYGLELSSKHNLQKWDIRFAYTLSWTERQFPAIDNGKAFPYRFDNRHALNIFVNYAISKHWRASASWAYRSGDHFSYPIARAIANPLVNSYFIYSGRNNIQLPVYHRLDLLLEYHKLLKNNRSFGIRFDVYNAYNKINPYYLRIRQRTILDDYGNPAGEVPEIKQVSVFPILPSINVLYKF